MNKTRRKILKTATSFTAGLGVGVAAIPFIRSLAPARSAPSEVIEFPKLEPGQIVTAATSWGLPLTILRRSTTMLDGLTENPSWLQDPMSATSEQPEFAKNALRSLNPETFVAVPLCTHLHCTVAFQAPGQYSFDQHCETFGCFHCPCHGSVFDLAGRVWRNQPATTNLIVPPHEYIDANTIKIDFGFQYS